MPRDSKLLAQVMDEPVFECVETFCCQKRGEVTLDLSLSKKPLGNLVSGSPVSCNCEASCSKGILCLLKAIRITTGRRKRYWMNWERGKSGET